MGLRFGIIGCGMIGRLYADRLAAMGHHIISASDPDIARARAIAKHGAGYAGHRDLLKAGGLDVACICSPTPHHHQAVMDCAEARLPVFLEKPMALTLAEARDMAEAMKAAGAVVGFGLKMRFEAIFAQARQLVQHGAIGRPRYATFAFYQPVPPGERIWYADIGVLRDMLVHPFDLAMWILDSEPMTVSARVSREIGRKGEDKASVHIGFETGAWAHVHGGYMPGFPAIAGREDIAFQIIGEEGYLLGKREDHLLAVNESGTHIMEVKPVDAFAAELAAFSDALARHAPLPVSDADGLRAQLIIAAAEQSAKESARTIELSSL